MSPLHEASDGGHAPAMKVLLEAGADPNAKDVVLDMRGMSVRV